MNKSLLRILVTLSDRTMFPIVRPGSIVQIDQNQRKVVQTKWEDEDDRPIYFVELRGEFICSWCEMRDGYLSAVPHPKSKCQVRRFAYPREADIWGRVDGVTMRLDQAAVRRPNIADSVDQVSTAVRRDIKFGADWIKLIVTGGVNDPTSDFAVQELSDAQIATAVEVAHRSHKRVMAHAHGTDGIKAAIRAGVDSIEHGSMLDDEAAKMMADRGVWLIPTVYVQEHILTSATLLGVEPIILEKQKMLANFHEQGFRRALKFHVKIAYGVDDEPEVAAKEFGAMVKWGMSPLAALQAATIDSAELLGLSKEIGSVEPDKDADIIAVDGDPLSDITVMERVVFVMKSGKIIKNEARVSGRLP